MAIDSLLVRWTDKIRTRTADRPVIAKWAVHLLKQLHTVKRLDCEDAKTVARKSHVPLKYFRRSLAVLQRFGLVTVVSSERRFSVKFRPTKRLKSGRGPLLRKGVAVSKKRSIYEADRGTCAVGGNRVRYSDAVLDHIIPLAYGGADHPANLVTVSRSNNQRKWDGFAVQIAWYRGERVHGKVGMRWRSGEFWPVVNGRVRWRR